MQDEEGRVEDELSDEDRAEERVAEDESGPLADVVERVGGPSVKPPQLDEFFLAQDAPLRADELRALALPQS